jgi:hypothetical protein
MPRPPRTRRPPPPDPIDAADEALSRAREANARFRDSADDWDEPTGKFDAPHFHVHVDPVPPPRAPLASVTEADIPKNHTLAGTLATLIAAAGAALIAKLLGRL